MDSQKENSGMRIKGGTWGVSAGKVLRPNNGYEIEVWSVTISVYDLVHGGCQWFYDRRRNDKNSTER